MYSRRTQADKVVSLRNGSVHKPTQGFWTVAAVGAEALGPDRKAQGGHLPAFLRPVVAQAREIAGERRERLVVARLAGPPRP